MKLPIMLLLVSLCSLAQEPKGSLTFSILGLKNEKGVIQVLLFKNANGFPDSSGKAVRQLTLPIKARKAQANFNDLPYGHYALACIHDENENKKQDINFFGYPLEGYGTSQNPPATWRKPNFDESVFLIDKKESSIQIQMKYLP